MTGATRAVSAVGDAVSRSVGIVESSVNQAVTWIKKHNQVIGKIGTFLSNVSGKLALAGLLIAPIPGLDALTPILEGAAVVTSIGALATQGIAKAAGDRNITYGDLFNDALGAIPAGGDAEDLDQGITTASHMTDSAAESASGQVEYGTTDLSRPSRTLEKRPRTADTNMVPDASRMGPYSLASQGVKFTPKGTLSSKRARGGSWISILSTSHVRPAARTV